jgi:hypothetical protein
MKTMSTLPTIGFDTRGINQLEDDGAQAEPFMKAMQCGFKVLLRRWRWMKSFPLQQLRARAGKLYLLDASDCSRRDSASGRRTGFSNCLLQSISRYKTSEIYKRNNGYEP